MKQRRTHPWTWWAVMVVGLITVLGLSLSAPAGAQTDPVDGSSDPSSSGPEPTPVTNQDLLLDSGQATTVAPEAVPSAPAPQPAPVQKSSDDSRKVWLVVAGLVAVAIGLTALTVVYIRRTSPRRRNGGEAPPPPDDPDPSGEGRRPAATAAARPRPPARPAGPAAAARPRPPARPGGPAAPTGPRRPTRPEGARTIEPRTAGPRPGPPVNRTRAPGGPPRRRVEQRR